MTITAIAKRLNVSTMTIYRRLKTAGISADTLRDETGDITPAGAGVIASLFDASQNEYSTTDDATADATGAAGVLGAGTVSADAARAAVLEARLEAAADTIKRLEAERDQLRNQLETISAALEREQADRAQERLLLTGPADNQRRRGFWWWRRRNV